MQWQKIVDAAAKLAALIDLVNALFAKWRGESGPWDDADEAEASKLLLQVQDAQNLLRAANSSDAADPDDTFQKDPKDNESFRF